MLLPTGLGSWFEIELALLTGLCACTSLVNVCVIAPANCIGGPTGLLTAAGLSIIPLSLGDGTTLDWSRTFPGSDPLEVDSLDPSLDGGFGGGTGRSCREGAIKSPSRLGNPDGCCWCGS